MATDRRRYKTAWQAKKRHEIREERAAMGDPVRIGRPRKEVPFIRENARIVDLYNASIRALRDLAFGGKEDISWRLFKWHATREFVRKSKKTAPSDYELLFAFQLLRDDEWVTPTGYSRRGFPISINAGGLL